MNHSPNPLTSAQVICDSQAPNGARLTTMVLKYPRFIHSEFMTHRAFSRNASSSRATPVQKSITAIIENPVVPIFGKNRAGMSHDEELVGAELHEATRIWLGARNACLAAAEQLMDMGVHKQSVNRLLEPFAYITVIASATDWVNFWRLRQEPGNKAQPEFQQLTQLMRAAYDASEPRPLMPGEWHLPFADDARQKLDNSKAPRVSVARCARVSYLNHDGAIDINKDIMLADQLESDGHWSPFEHQAIALSDVEGLSRSGNFKGFLQYRQMAERMNRSR